MLKTIFAKLTVNFSIVFENGEPQNTFNTTEYVALGKQGEDLYPIFSVFYSKFSLSAHLEPIRFHFYPCHTGVLYLEWSVITLQGECRVIALFKTAPFAL